MNPLELRKRLLIEESELNRAQLVQEWHAMAHDVRSLTNRVKTIGSFASVRRNVGCRPVVLLPQKIHVR
ncbi:MAG: hypothetical protein WDM76_07150 [Limisphaerales bacterium]